MISADSNTYHIAIIGGGIVGAATAYMLQEAYPHLKIALFEKEKNLAHHQTGNNSGVIHSGIYYKPGSHKARNCTRGRKLLVQFAKKHAIPHDVCGKIIVAVNAAEEARLQGIYERGLANEIEGIARINQNEIRELEPFCSGIAGIHVPCTGIIDYRATTEKLIALIQEIQPQTKVFMETEVHNVTNHEKGKTLHTSKGNINTRFAIFCAGLQSDRLAKKDEVKPEMQIVGFRGDYYELEEHALHKVKNLIYPVPNPAFPFLGVHFTRMVKGGVECGPNAVFTFKREGYSKTAFSFSDTAAALSYIGTWKLFAKHWKFGLEEYKRAFSRALFLKTLQQLIPDLKNHDLKPGRAGVRAMALAPNGEMIDDFHLKTTPSAIHVLNAPSPAASAALAIAEDIKKLADTQFVLSDLT
jgi:L-2-hydroxyglutarate oxidase